MDAHSLLTAYEWMAERVADQRVLVVGIGSGAGPSKLATHARQVIAYDRSKDIIGEASFTFGHLSNLYFAVGDPSDVIREASRSDVVVALETATTRAWLDQIAQIADDTSHPMTLITSLTNPDDQLDPFRYRSVINMWGVRASVLAASPSPADINFEDWGEPVNSIGLASNQPIDSRWTSGHLLVTPQSELGNLALFNETRALEQRLKASQAQIASILNSRIIQLALRGRRLIRRLRSVLRTARPSPIRETPASPAATPNRATIEDRIRKLRPDTGPIEGPLVSIVVLTHNGAEPLSRLLRGLEERTAYKSFEVVVVDNASVDHTASLLESYDWSFPIRAIRSETNLPFSEGSNAGAELGDGDLLLFLNNDVEPINGGWLGAMVESLTRDDKPRAVGALLIHPEIHPKLETPFPVQHRGVEFRWREGRPIGVHMGVGESPLDPSLSSDSKVPALTGACLMVRRRDFDRVEGFTRGFVYGLEDIDLCLKLRDIGAELRLCGQAALFHKESTTQRSQDSTIRDRKRINNAQLFDRRWKTRLERSLLIDQLTGAGEWKRGPQRAYIVLPSDETIPGTLPAAIAAGFQANGWIVELGKINEPLPADLDLTIVMSGLFDVGSLQEGSPALAWPLEGFDSIDDHWAENFHLIAAVNRRVADALQERLNRKVKVIRSCVDASRFQPVQPEAALQCDYAIVAASSQNDSLLGSLQVGTDERFLLFGRGWQDNPIAAPYYRGELASEDIRLLYSSIKILIHSMFLDPDPSSSQIFTALACGALVVTDDAQTSSTHFDSLLPVFTDFAELRSTLDLYVKDDQARQELTSKLRRTVVNEYNATDKAPQIVSCLINALNPT